MAATTPPVYTPVHKEEIEVDESMTEETSRKMVQNSNWLLDLRPIRSIVFIEVNQNGVPPIDLSTFQECDGSEITNPNSPIRSVGAVLRFTPNYQDRYPRVTQSFGGTNNLGGNQTKDFNHDHTGFTQVGVIQGPTLERDGGKAKEDLHVHALAADLNDGVFFDAPKFLKTIAYMRIV